MERFREGLQTSALPRAVVQGAGRVARKGVRAARKGTHSLLVYGAVGALFLALGVASVRKVYAGTRRAQCLTAPSARVVSAP